MCASHDREHLGFRTASSRLANVAANSPCAFDRPEKAESERNKREVGAPSLSARGVPKSQERGVAVLVDERGVEKGHSSKSRAIFTARWLNFSDAASR